jgi:organic hydroperoxide reductase OsmC/OhrA
VVIRGLDQATSEEIVEAAHFICPYSNALRGNVDVTTTVKAL